MIEREPTPESNTATGLFVKTAFPFPPDFSPFSLLAAFHQDSATLYLSSG
jgi:hypothetical protein